MSYGEAFTNKVKFQTQVRLSDGAGGFVPGIEKITILDTFAKIKPIKATRVAENFQGAINSVYEIKLLKRAGFNPVSNLHVIWNDKDYSIVEIIENPKDTKEWLITVIDRGSGVSN